MIRFLEPWWLLALLPVLAIAAAYVWRQFRRRAYAVRFTNLELLSTLAPKGLGWRRHAAAGAFLLSLVALASAMARPAVDTEQPLERATIMLAIDVSLSMQADDVAPNRIQAAQEAAKQFVDQLPASFNVGLVAFAKAANVLVSPTKDRAAVNQAIDGLTLAEATATGEAVFTSLEAIRSVPADGAQGAPPPPRPTDPTSRCRRSPSVRTRARWRSAVRSSGYRSTGSRWPNWPRRPTASSTRRRRRPSSTRCTTTWAARSASGSSRAR